MEYYGILSIQRWEIRPGETDRKDPLEETLAQNQRLKFSVVGAGRIGEVHAKNIARNPYARVSSVFDVNRTRANDLADQVDANVAETIEDALSKSNCDGVIICSATNTHADLIERAAREGVAIFCEKPIDLDIERVEACADNVKNSDSIIQLGFNRRFDPSHANVRNAVENNELGRLQHVLITSRDPHPPHAEYIPVSGGIFRDMAIHDFDMACFLCAERPVSLYASGASLVSKEIQAAGDFDTATISLKMPSGVIVTIQNSRNCAYGYDQRLEVFGTEGMIQSANQRATSVVRHTGAATQVQSPYQDFFQDRYRDSYRVELDDFIDCVIGNKKPSCNFDDGRTALIIANAAEQSARSSMPVEVKY